MSWYINLYTRFAAKIICRSCLSWTTPGFALCMQCRSVVDRENMWARKSEREESGPTRHGRNARQHKAIVVEATTYLSYRAATARVFSVMMTATTANLACLCYRTEKKNIVKKEWMRDFLEEKPGHVAIPRYDRKKENWFSFFLSASVSLSPSLPTWKRKKMCSLFFSFLFSFLVIEQCCNNQKNVMSFSACNQVRSNATLIVFS